MTFTRFPYCVTQASSLPDPTTVLSAHPCTQAVAPHLLFCNLLTHSGMSSPPLSSSIHSWPQPCISFHPLWPWPSLFSNPSLRLQVKLTTVPLICKVWILKGSFKCKCHLVPSCPWRVIKEQESLGKARKLFHEGRRGNRERFELINR